MSFAPKEVQIEVLQKFLEDNLATKWIRVQWIDYSGVLRARFVPVARCIKIASESDVMHLAQNSMLIPISTAPRIFSLSDYHETWDLCPDWMSIRRCGFHAGHASVMSTVDQKDSLVRFDKCPRTLLFDTAFNDELDWNGEPLAGFEIEFVLLNEAGNVIKPMDRVNGYSRTAGLYGETLNIVEEIVEALQQSSINIHHFHTEVQDQLEIAPAPQPISLAVDSLVIAQETIRAVCMRRNLRASMAPKPTPSGPSNGIHLHISMKSIDLQSAENFLAGVLSHMGSLCAFGMANYDSYVPSKGDATGAWIGFGTDNRDLPVRKISDDHFEFRMMDGTANPYLFTAALLSAGLDVLRNETKLTWKDCKVFPHLMDEKELAEYGIEKAMPVTLKESLDCLKKDDVLKEMIGENMVKWFISVKDKEVEEFEKMSDEQRRLRFLEYF